jgi:hypothetical protein
MWGFHLPMHIRKEGYTSVEGLEACSAYASARCLFAWLGYHRASVSSRDALSEGLSHLGRGQQFPLIAMEPLSRMSLTWSVRGWSRHFALMPIE